MKLILLGWRVLLFLIIFEGAIRKWMFPQASTAIYLLKDLVVFGMLMYVLLDQDNRKYWSVLRGWRLNIVSSMFTLYAFMVMLQAFNPKLPSILLGLWGLKAHILYAALLIIVPTLYYRYPMQLWKDVRFILWAGVAVAMLGMLQYSLPPDHYLNKYASDMVEVVATFGDARGSVRVTGTFPYITGMMTFMFVVSLLALTLIVNGTKLWKRKYIVIVVFAAAMVGSTMTGGRWGLYAYGIVLPIVVVMFGWARSRKVLVSLSMLAPVLLVSSMLFGNVTSSFMYRASTAGDEDKRVSAQSLGFTRYIDEAGVLGFGAGATNQAAPVLVAGGDFEWLKPIIMSDFEDEPSRALVEFGIIGFSIWLTVKVLLLVFGWRIAQIARRRPEFPLAVWSVGYLAAMFTSSVDFNPTASFFYWYSIALLIYIDHQIRSSNRPILSYQLRTA